LECNNVRIFKPDEISTLLKNIPGENKPKFEVLLYTGARYSEVKRLFSNPLWLEEDILNLPNRSIRLNKNGVRAVHQYLACKKSLPHYVTWGENMKRWCENAGIEKTNLSIKSTRNTWGAWLVAKYPDKLFEIFKSQGHKELNTLERYSKLDFSKDDLDSMESYVEGWI